MRKFVPRSIVSVALLICMNLPAIGQSANPTQITVRFPTTNRDIVQMVKAKFADSTIIKAIQANDTNFDLSVTALVGLKNAGVSQAVIEEMLSVGANKKSSNTAAVATPKPQPLPSPSDNPTTSVPVDGTPASDLPTEIGVYVRQHGVLVAIEPENVNWRTGGVVKTVATLGLDKGHVNGKIVGPHSTLILQWPQPGRAGTIEFYIRCPEGSSASEYQLLRLWNKEDRREFRAVTGGILHSSGGAEDNSVQFKYEKMASRTYKIELPGLGAGEYGFLAPGAVAIANVASQGSIYSFRILE